MFEMLSQPYILGGILGGTILLSLSSLLLVLQTRSRLRKIFGTETREVLSILQEMRKSLRERENFEKEMKEFLGEMNERVKASVKSPDLVRFEPFKGISSGGNQSFSLSLVDEKGDGLVLSGLYYSRDRVSIFAKPTEKYQSSFELTPEEKEVLDASKKKR